jgi:DNA-binding NtrC family response regulator
MFHHIYGERDVSSAVEALKLGAYDYIIKPFDPEHLKLVNKARPGKAAVGPA